MAMATVFIDIFTIVGEMGISSALIQKQDAVDIHYSSAFWLNIGTGIILTLIFIVCSPLIAMFYGKPELRLILTLLSFNFIFSSFTIIQQAILMKEMEFKKLAIRDIASVLLSGVVGIQMAFSGFGTLSLVGQSLCFTFMNAILLWFFSNWRPKLSYSKAHMHDIFHFSANLTGSYIINLFGRNIDKLLIGKFMGDQALGVYSLSYKLMLYPLQNVSWVISRVMFPVFSKIQTNVVKIQMTYLGMLKTISLITFPLMIGLFAITPEFVHVIFGTKWESSITIIRLFCICGMIQSVTATGGTIILSQKRADLQFKMQVMGAITALIAILLGMHWGINCVALFYTVQSLFFLHYTLYITGKIIYLNCGMLYSKLASSFLYSFAMGAIVFVMKYLLDLPGAYKFGCLIIGGIISYIIILAISKEIMFENNKFVLKSLSGY